MSSTFDLINEPILPNSMSSKVDPLIQTPVQFQQQLQSQSIINTPVQQVPYEQPEIITGGFSFTTKSDDDTDDKLVISTGSDIIVEQPKKRRSRKKENTEIETVSRSEIIGADNTTVETPTIYSYYETADMLKNTMAQLDQVASELKIEFDSVRASRTLKGKYNTMVGLAGNLSEVLEAKISAIKEMNNCISKSNDLDYKREKDRKEAASSVNDDKMIMDLYNAFIQNPMGPSPQPNMGPLGPTPLASSLAGTGIIRESADQNTYDQNGVDAAYMNYLANITPQQNAMLYEHNPDIKQVVVYDAATNNRWFQVMNVKTGQVIPNAQVHDQMFLEDTTINLKDKIAKNINLNETYPVVVINDTHEY